MATQTSSRLQLWSACLGNFFEHYDAALFGFLSPFLAPLIFPELDLIVALILTYAMIPLGMIARPLGAIFFGRIGDAYGRRQALFLTLAGMSVVSACVAISPTFAQAGVIAPLLFCFSRFAQNFLSAGENMGGAIFLLENTCEEKHDILSSLYSASTIGGIILASAGVSLLSLYGFLAEGWRLLYVLGCLTALFGCLIRCKLPSGLIIQQTAVQNDPPQKNILSVSDLLQILWTYRRPLFIISISAGFSYANYSVALVLINGFIPLISSLTKEHMIHLNTLLLVLDFALLPLFGWIASKISREKMMLGAALGIVASAIPLFMILENATLASVIGVRICLVLFGVAFAAPFHAWAQPLVPPAHRYTVISFAHAIGSQLFGGPTVVISLWLFKSTGMISSISWYWLALALVTSVALIRGLARDPIKNFDVYA
ncbi:MAG: MFS transporter [Parachlamydiaceae bacterium]